MEFNQFVSSNLSRKDFEFLGSMASHAYGRVEKAKYVKEGKEYALKIYEKHALDSPEVMRKALKEKEVLSQLKSAGVLALSGSFVDIENIYLVFEHYSNGTLLQFMQRFAKFPFGLARFYAGELVSILSSLRPLHVVHTDITPSNLVVSSDFHLKLCNFTDSSTSDRINRSSAAENPEYLSPESLNGEFSHSSDVWSVGCIIYQMLVGKSPFFSSSNSGTIEKINSGIMDFPGLLPPFAIDLIQSMLLPDPAIRLGSNNVKDLEQHIFFQGLEIETIYRNPAPDYRHEMAKESEAKSKIIYEGIVKKKAGWIYKRRLLIISDEPRISYYEPTRRELRGEIAISPQLRGEVKNKIDFHVITPKRTYYFKVISDAPDKWVKAVAELVHKLYGR